MVTNNNMVDKIVDYIFELINIQNVSVLNDVDINTNDLNTDIINVTNYTTLSKFKKSVYNNNLTQEQGGQERGGQERGRQERGRQERGGRTRHEIQLTPYLTKGYITVTVKDRQLWLFYYCNVVTGLFRMWNLKCHNIGTWLNANNRQLYNNRWLEDIICLVLFHEDKCYFFQHTPARYFSSAITLFPNDNDRCELSTSNMRYDAHHVNYTQLVSCQLPTNEDKFARVDIFVPSYYLHDCKKIFFFHYGIYYLMKYIFDDEEYKTITYSECCIHNDRHHGLFREWTSFDRQDKINWLNYAPTPMNGFSNKLCRIVTRVEGKDHGLSFEYYRYSLINRISKITNYCYGNRHGPTIEYNNNGDVTCRTNWSNDDRHGWSIKYSQRIGCHYAIDIFDSDNDSDNDSDTNTNNDDDNDDNTNTNDDDDPIEIDDDDDSSNSSDSDSDSDNSRDSRDYGEDMITRLYYFDRQITKSKPLMYLGLYFLCRDGYMICHDDKTNSFLSYFDKLPPEIMESILQIMCSCDKVCINKFFTSAGIDIILYPLQ